jgi:hypothetical protein
VELDGLFSRLVPNLFSPLPVLLSVLPVRPSLTGSTFGSERLSLINSGLALLQPRCASRGNISDPCGLIAEDIVEELLPLDLFRRLLWER